MLIELDHEILRVGRHVERLPGTELEVGVVGRDLANLTGDILATIVRLEGRRDREADTVASDLKSTVHRDIIARGTIVEHRVLIVVGFHDGVFLSLVGSVEPEVTVLLDSVSSALRLQGGRVDRFLRSRTRVVEVDLQGVVVEVIRIVSINLILVVEETLVLVHDVEGQGRDIHVLDIVLLEGLLVDVVLRGGHGVPLAIVEGVVRLVQEVVSRDAVVELERDLHNLTDVSGDVAGNDLAEELIRIVRILFAGVQFEQILRGDLGISGLGHGIDAVAVDVHILEGGARTGLLVVSADVGVKLVLIEGLLIGVELKVDIAEDIDHTFFVKDKS